MMPLFSPTGVGRVGGLFEKCVGEFVARLREEAKGRREVDVLNLAEAFACDVTTGCLFGGGTKLWGVEGDGGAVLGGGVFR